ncbi:GNAT family N-acetyltransferase [Sporosarcina gallistercoris]|uniref:GNAT family N-acetyltransferase n=1 Tax=Sporosarcina gallistercoris TaxID=2762245 RepID=A0ABR8PM47_9BACL|nr:GNAT family N-acetyltransferase [Sporosarcina gallistercoris]MBD7909248.1 GNAT family N-acetyltransferase [Sporosarcina gallistercoris]
MHIREIEEKDNTAIEKIIKHSLESVGLDIPGTAYFDPQLGELAQFYRGQQGAAYWIAVDDEGKVAGGVGIGPYDQKNGICELQKLYIAPEFQGQGLSKELMATALGFARDHYDYCYLETSQKLSIANRLYSKLGFDLLEEPLEGSEHGAMDAWYLKKL